MDEAVIRVKVEGDGGGAGEPVWMKSLPAWWNAPGWLSTPPAWLASGPSWVTKFPPWFAAPPAWLATPPSWLTSLPPWWGVVTWMVNPPAWLSAPAPAWLAAPPPAWLTAAPAWFTTPPPWLTTSPSWFAAAPRWFTTMPVWMTRLPPWWTTVAGGGGRGATTVFSLSPLLALLSTPGSAYFQNMVLAFRTGGAGAGAAAPGTGRAILGVFNTSVASATSAVANFAAQLITANASVGQYLQGIGSSAQSAGAGLALIKPIAGATVEAFGAVISGLGLVMQTLDGLARRYGQFSPAIAQAEAMAEIRQTIGDIRRAREAAPDLVQYIQQRQEVQQKIEDAKIRIMKAIMPSVIKITELTEKFMPLIEAIVNILTTTLEPIIDIANFVSGIFGNMNDTKAKEKDVDYDIAAIIREGYVEPGSDREKELKKKGKRFFETPSL